MVRRMIEITIPYWIGAALVFIGMLAFISLAIACALVKAWDFVAFCIVIVLIIDAFSVVASSGYMTTPSDILCCEQCNQHWYNETPHCIYPTINPYEQQPLHPILWFLKSGEFVFTGFGGMINIKHEVI